MHWCLESWQRQQMESMKWKYCSFELIFRENHCSQSARAFNWLLISPVKRLKRTLNCSGSSYFTDVTTMYCSLNFLCLILFIWAVFIKLFLHLQLSLKIIQRMILTPVSTDSAWLCIKIDNVMMQCVTALLFSYTNLWTQCFLLSIFDLVLI